MAASANPTGNNQKALSNQKVTAPPTIANGISLISNSSEANTSALVAGLADTQAALRHNPGISINWTPDEQSILEDLLAKYASDSTIVRYAKIAMRLKDKTVRDVALRCRWMTKKENGKRRKEDHISTRKSKDRRVVMSQEAGEQPDNKLRYFRMVLGVFFQVLAYCCLSSVQVDKDVVSQERSTDSLAKSTSVLTARPNGPSYVSPITQMDNDDGIPYKAFWGATGELLDQNAQIFNQISANFSAFQTLLLVRNTINVVIAININVISVKIRKANDPSTSGSEANDATKLNELPEVMEQMPPLPEKINEEKANEILPPSSLQMKS
ncbi:hypothetical protein GOBAR_AA37081 [Gossypium barbadense]|uniref:Myb-like domain-containing protein n=1 Tax=Gossypium barbadense TaxID=3634 RepID=A0A2P5VXR3_GOSBA|nr:hypothetical protein GOBAR_AA37081 [Gossypium barbadense]